MHNKQNTNNYNQSIWSVFRLEKQNITNNNNNNNNNIDNNIYNLDEIEPDLFDYANVDDILKDINCSEKSIDFNSQNLGGVDTLSELIKDCLGMIDKQKEEDEVKENYIDNDTINTKNIDCSYHFGAGIYTDNSNKNLNNYYSDKNIHTNNIYNINQSNQNNNNFNANYFIEVYKLSSLILCNLIENKKVSYEKK